MPKTGVGSIKPSSSLESNKIDFMVISVHTGSSLFGDGNASSKVVGCEWVVSGEGIVSDSFVEAPSSSSAANGNVSSKVVVIGGMSDVKLLAGVLQIGLLGM